MAIAIALLAAGAARRMRGRDKLVETVAGRPLLRLLAERALAAGLGPVAVTLPPGGAARHSALDGLALARLTVPDAAEGMAASLRVAAAWAGGMGATGLMICPADMPEIETGDFRSLAAGFDPAGPPHRAAAQDGTPGHPVLFPARVLPEFAALAGDRGAQAILHRHPPRVVPLPGRRALCDLDTPEDWNAWRGR